MAELTVEEVSVRFGGVQALLDVDLTVPAGAVTGLIGPNGAGKTTLFNVITGLQVPTRGAVRLDGRDITRLRPHRRARLGVGRTFQRLEVAGTLTARENVLLAAEGRPGRVPDGTTAWAWAGSLLARVGAGQVADQPADALPTGLARLVELARALATAPTVLLVDEPSSGLDPAETEALGAVLADLASEGMAVLLVEHDMSLVMRVCDQVTVLDYGETIARGAPAEVRADPAVQRAYLGDPKAVAARPGAYGAEGRRPAADDAPALELRDVRAAYGRIEVVHGVSLSVAGGEVCALLGPNGAGKSTLLKVISGRLAPTAGQVLVGGEPAGTHPGRLARQGVCSIPEGRAVFPNLTVAENLRMYTYRGRQVTTADLEARTFERFPRLADRRRQLAGTLSGGEQQMLALARALFTGPKVLLLDEISMGLAPLVVDELYETVARLVADEQLTVLVVEQFATTALAMATRAAIMVNGEIVRTGSPADVERDMVSSYLGTGAA